ncbi:MAG: DNA alkylation repair protein [Bacteroidota bacterium]
MSLIEISMIAEEIRNRKGPRKAQDIIPEVLSLLNTGQIQTVNLTEWLAIDHVKLISEVFPSLGISNADLNTVIDKLKRQKKLTSMSATKTVGHMLYDLNQGKASLYDVFDRLSAHQSDAIRCYSPYLIALDHSLDLKEKLNRVKPLVADEHFGLREVVWMAMRPEINRSLDQAIKLLTNWTRSEDDNIRRFTTEVSRPRGVWCKHIDRLKEDPNLALPILENLKSDPSKYVQDSVANWLNDASKTQAQFVIDLCDRWRVESPTKETQRIVKRARRTIDKG